MSVRATVTDVMRNFSDYVSRVAYRGERFTLMRGGKEVAELVPPAPAARPLAELPEMLASLPRLGEDEARLWASDLERARAELDHAPRVDPWGS